MTRTSTTGRVRAAEARTQETLVRCVGEQRIPYHVEELAVMARYVVRDQLVNWPPLPDEAEAVEPAPRLRIALPPSDRHLLALVAEGLDNSEVADRLGVSERVVCTRLRRVYGLLGAKNRTHAVALGFLAGVLVVDAGPVTGPVRPPAASNGSDRARGASGAERAAEGHPGAVAP